METFLVCNQPTRAFTLFFLVLESEHIRALAFQDKMEKLLGEVLAAGASLAMLGTPPS